MLTGLACGKERARTGGRGCLHRASVDKLYSDRFGQQSRRVGRHDSSLRLQTVIAGILEKDVLFAYTKLDNKSRYGRPPEASDRTTIEGSPAMLKAMGRGVLALVLGSVLVAAQAAPTLVVNGTTLTGARNVDVNGTLYDVDFLDGTCVAIFSGCNAISDFTFQSDLSAQAASQALLDQVF